MRKPVPDARRGMSNIQGAAQFGSTNSVKIWTTDFSGSEPSGSGVPWGGAAGTGAGVVAAGWLGAIDGGSPGVGFGVAFGTVAPGMTGGVADWLPEGGVTTLVEAA